MFLLNLSPHLLLEECVLYEWPRSRNQQVSCSKVHCWQTGSDVNQRNIYFLDFHFKANLPFWQTLIFFEKVHIFHAAFLRIYEYKVQKLLIFYFFDLFLLSHIINKIKTSTVKFVRKQISYSARIQRPECSVCVKNYLNDFRYCLEVRIVLIATSIELFSYSDYDYLK